MEEKFEVVWLDAQREPQCAPNPNYPDGKDIDVGQRPACKVDLPYPAKRIGAYTIACRECGMTAGVTTAGRPDDPRSIMLPCKRVLTAEKLREMAEAAKARGAVGRPDRFA